MELPSDWITCFVNSMSRDYSTSSNSICILRLSAIGDCCHTLAVARTLQAALPQTSITWVIGKTEHRLLGDAHGIEFITFDKTGGTGALLDLRKQMRGRNFDVLLNMNASMRANIVSLAIPARRRIGFDKARARDFQWAFCNERIAPLQMGKRHVLDGLFQFAEHIGVTDRQLHWDIPISAEDHTFAAQLTEHAPTCVISPCSSQRARNFRNWNIANYVELIAYLQASYGAKVILTGANSDIEQEYARELTARTSGVTDLIAKTTLKQLFALIDAATLVICPDSGPAHMATAAGTPIIGLYATSNPERTGPYIDRQLTANRYPDAVQKEFGKSADEVRFGQRVRNPDAMDLITIADVKQKVDLVLGGLPEGI
jgi:heptosyltransferase I